MVTPIKPKWTKQSAQDKALEQAGLLNYQTQGKSQQEIAQGYEKAGINVQPAWFKQQYGSNPDMPPQPQRPPQQQLEGAQVGGGFNGVPSQQPKPKIYDGLSPYQYWLKEKDRRLQNTLGYLPTAGQDPKWVANAYHQIKAAPNDEALPEYLRAQKEQITEAYNWFSFRNKDKPWTEWGYLDATDPAHDFLKNIQPAPKPTYGEAGVFASHDQVIADKAAWGDMDPNERKKILSDPNFYNGAITKYSPAMQQEILKDPNFNWGNLPGWQRVAFGIISNPAIMNSPMALAGWHAGAPLGLIGRITGAAGAYALGMVGGQEYDPTKGIGEQPTAAAAAMRVLNVLSEYTEQSAGYIGQVADAAIAGAQGNEQAAAAARKMITDPVTRQAAFDVGRITYEYGDLGGRVLTNLLQWMSGEEARAGGGEDFVLGSSAPVDKFKALGTSPITGKQQYYTDVMQILMDARHQVEAEIRAGGDPDVIINKYIQDASNYVGSLAQDFALQSMIDPLEQLGPVTNAAGAAISKTLGNNVAARAFATTNGLTEAARMYKDYVQGPMANIIDPTFDRSQMGSLARFFGGLNERGEVRAGPLTNRGLLDNGPRKPGVKGWIEEMTALAPEARADLGNVMFHNNIGALIAEMPTVKDAVGFIKDMATGASMEQWAELGKLTSNSPQLYTVLPALQDFAFDKLDAIEATVMGIQPDVNRLLEIADVLGVEPAKLLDDLSSRGTKQQDFARLISKLPKDHPLQAEIAAGKFTADSLADMVKMFTGKDALPWHPGQWKAMIYDALGAHFDAWAAKHFNLQPDNKFFRTAHLLKAAQSMLLLGANPGYAITNGLTNMVHRAATGIYGYMTTKQMDTWMDRFGVTPARLNEAFGFMGLDNADPMNTAGMHNDAQRLAMRGNDGIQRAQDLVRQINRVLPFNKLSSFFERTEGKQGFVIAMRKFWGQAWRRGVGFKEMPAALVQEIRSLGMKPELIYAAIEAGMNQAEVEKALFSRQVGIAARSLVQEAAQERGIPTQEASGILESLGVLDALDAELKGADNIRKVFSAFERARRTAKNMIDIGLMNDIVARVPDVATRLEVEGAPALLDVAVSVTEPYITAWYEHLQRMGNLWGTMDDTQDPAFNNKRTEIEYSKSNDEFRRIAAWQAATWKAILEKQGMLDSDFGRGILTTMADTDKALAGAYQFMLDQKRKHFEQYRDDWNNKNLTRDWQRLEKRVRREFEKAFAVEQKSNRKQRDLFEKYYGDTYGKAAGEAARQLWQDIIDFRSDMLKRMKEQRDTGQPYSREFYQETYMPMILEMGRIREEGAKLLRDVIALGKDPAPKPDYPTTPADQITPEETAAQAGEAGEQAMRANDEMIAKLDELERQADKRAEEAKTNEQKIWEMAGNYISRGADTFDPDRYGDQFHLLATLRKEEYGGSSNIKTWQDVIDNMTPQDVDYILRNRDEYKRIQAEEEAARAKAEDERRAPLRAELEKIKEFTTKPRHELSPELSEAFKIEAQRISNVINGGEPGKRLFDTHGDIQGGGFIGYTRSTYPSWYNELQAKNGGRKGLLKALDKIVIDNGADKGAVVERLKEFIVEAFLYGDEETRQVPNLTALKAMGMGDDVLMRALEEFNRMTNTTFTLEEVLANDYAKYFENLDKQFDAPAPAPEPAPISTPDQRQWLNDWDVQMEEAIAINDELKVLELIGEFPPELEGSQFNSWETYGEFIRHIYEDVVKWKEEAEQTNTIAEALTRNDMVIEEQRNVADVAMTREIMIEKYEQAFPNVTREQIAQWMEASDAVIETMAKALGKTKDEIYLYYKDILRGEGGDLNQSRLTNVYASAPPEQLDIFVNMLWRQGENALRSAVENEKSGPDRVALMQAIARRDQPLAVKIYQSLPKEIFEQRNKRTNLYHPDLGKGEYDYESNVDAFGQKGMFNDNGDRNVREFWVRKGMPVEVASGAKFNALTSLINQYAPTLTQRAQISWNAMAADVLKYLDRPENKMPAPASDALGGIEFLNGQAVIKAMEGADFSTVVHENAHLYRRMMLDASRRTGNIQWAEDYATLQSWVSDEAQRINAKIQAGETLSDYENVVSGGVPIPQIVGDAWQVGHEEIMARAFERYITEGKAPKPALVRVFENFKRWMLDVYKTLFSSEIDVPINDNVRAVFDRLLGGEARRKLAEPIGKLNKNTLDGKARSILNMLGVLADAAEDNFYKKFPGGVYQDLSIETHGRLIYFTQYTEMGGDLLIDSETIMRIQDDGTLALHETAALGPYQEARGKDAAFAKIHLDNLLEQFRPKDDLAATAPKPTPAAPEPLTIKDLADGERIIIARPTPNEPTPAQPEKLRPQFAQEPPKLTDKGRIEGDPTYFKNLHVFTRSGRDIGPAPTIRGDGGSRAISNDLKTIDKWLLSNGILEAQARGDDFNMTSFGGMKADKLTVSDRYMLNDYLFGVDDLGELLPKVEFKPDPAAEPIMPEVPAGYEINQVGENQVTVTKNGITVNIYKHNDKWHASYKLKDMVAAVTSMPITNLEDAKQWAFNVLEEYKDYKPEQINLEKLYGVRFVGDAREAKTFDEFMNTIPDYLQMGGKLAESVDYNNKQLTVKELYDLKSSNPNALVSGKFYTAKRGGVARREFKVSLLDLPADPQAFYDSLHPAPTQSDAAKALQSGRDGLLPIPGETPAPIPPQTFGKPQQAGLFGAGEDSPLFSGAVQTVKDEAYNPKPEVKQEGFFETRPEFGQKLEENTIKIKEGIVDSQEIAPEPPAPPTATREKMLLDALVTRVKNRDLFAKSRDFEAFISTLGFNLEDEADLNLAYDIMEGAFNIEARDIRAGLDDMGASLADRLAAMDELERRLTEARRTLSKMKLQQFSTPLTISEAAGFAADVVAGDIVGEPTAGTANLVDLFSQRQDVQVVVNEFDPNRRQVLEMIGYQPTGMDLMSVDWVIQDGKKAGTWATVMISNPPWGSYSTGKYGTPINTPVKMNDWSQRFTYLEMLRLAPDGRFVGVMPANWLYTMDRKTRAITNKPSEFYQWLKKNHTVQAVIESPPDAYKQRGTDVSSLLVVIDRRQSATPVDTIERYGSNQPKTWAEYAALVENLPKRSEEGIKNAQQSLRTNPAGPNASGIIDPAAISGTDTDPGNIGKPVSYPGERTPQPAGNDRAGQDVTERPTPPADSQYTEQPGGEGGDPGADVVDGNAPAIQDGTEQFNYSDEFKQKLEDGRAAVRDSGIFTEYVPRSPLGPGEQPHPHPTVVVETKLLAGIQPPPLEMAYKPTKTVMDAMKRRVLSVEGNLDPIWAAVQQNDKYGMGMLIADDVGMGKSRTAAGFVLDRIDRGKKRILVITKDEQNVLNLMQDEFPQVYGGTATETGAFVDPDNPPKDFPAKLMRLSGMTPWDLPAENGPIVYFIHKDVLPSWTDKISQYHFDVVVVDEAHEFKNISGQKKTARATSWIRLHKTWLADKANFLYLSATPGTDLVDLQYLFGLRAWTMDGFAQWIQVLKGEISEGDAKKQQAAIKLVEDYKTKVEAAAAAVDSTTVLRNNKPAIQVGDITLFKEGSNKDSYKVAYKGNKSGTTIYSEAQALIEADMIRQDMAQTGAVLDVWDIARMLNYEYTDKFKAAYPPPPVSEISSLGITEAGEIIRDGAKNSWGKSNKRSAYDSTLPPAHTEQIMRELKVSGSYMSRDISRAGVVYDVKEYKPPAEAKKQMNDRIQLYRDIYNTWKEFVKLDPRNAANKFGVTGDIQADAKRALFNMRLPGIVEEAKAAIAKGEKVVISIVSVSEVDGEKGSLLGGINKINVEQVEDLGDNNYSDPTKIPEAWLAVNDLKERLRSMPVLKSPIDVLREVFGDKVDFVHGGISSVDKRRAAARKFRNDQLDVIVISGAGKTGISLHDITGKRGSTDEGGNRHGVHLIVGDYEWSATTFKQELGRVDRTGQMSSPYITIMHTGSAGEKKFISTIVARMAGVGAVSKGGSESTGVSGVMEDFELGTTLDKIALSEMWNDIDFSQRLLFLDHNLADATTLDPTSDNLEAFLKALQSMPMEDANNLYDMFMAYRQKRIDGGEINEKNRAAKLTGEILRTTPLNDKVSISEVRNAEGAKFGILHGILTPHMNDVKNVLIPSRSVTEALLRGEQSKPWQTWQQFTDANTNVNLSGLRIDVGKIGNVMEYFGRHRSTAHTVEGAAVDLRAGDRIKIVGNDGVIWELYTGKGGAREGKIVVDGAKLKDRDALMRNGALYNAVGSYFFVPEDKLRDFFNRFPIHNEDKGPQTLEQRRKKPAADPFEGVDPRMPLGMVDNASQMMPNSQIMQEGWNQHVMPLLDSMRNVAVRRLGERQLDGASRDLSAEGQAMMRKYMKQVQADMAGVKLATIQHGETQRDFAMLNYNRRYGFDKFLDVYMPYQFFYTRSMMNWGMRALDKPHWFANYARLRMLQNKRENDLPERLRNKIRIPAPWLPDWMGDALYIDPLKVLFTPANFLNPLETMQRDATGQMQEATRIIQEWAADGTISDAEVKQAMSGSGPTYERALAEAKIRRESEISNPLDFFNAMFGPAWYLTTPYKALTGQGDTISQLPITRTANAVEAVTRGSWAEGIGKIVGLVGKPEQMIRQAAGVPEFGEYGDYYIDRALAVLVADGKASPQQATQAMIERSGPLFEEARQRVQMELAMRVPLAGTLYGALHGGPKDAAQAALPSLFGAGLLPAGELEYRGLKGEWNAAWKRADAGDKTAIQEFFDEHPEYEAYLAKGKQPEERLKSFLVGQIWDGYMALGETDKRTARSAMGEKFQQAFLDKETRSYESLDTQTLTTWAQMLSMATPKPEAMNIPDMPAAGPINYYPPEVTAITDQYFEDRSKKFPNYYMQEQGYYSLPKSERAAYLMKFPQLREYWRWKDSYTKQYPELAPIIKGQVFKTVDTSNWPPMLEDVVTSYALGSSKLGSGAWKSLEQIWLMEGAPMGDVKTWVNSQVIPALLYQQGAQ